MAYSIFRNCLSLMCSDNELYDIEHNSHTFMWDRCNFRCRFCHIGVGKYKDSVKTIALEKEKFILAVINLLPDGKNFKFTGGEATLNPRLEWELRVVKDLGGTVFLDSNGSNFTVIKNLLDNNLIDVLGISLKGLTPEEALKTADIKNVELCWYNVLKTIEYASTRPNVRVIVTHVCYNDVSYEELMNFAKILEPFDNVVYKINNLLKECHRDDTLTRVDSNKLLSFLKKMVQENPKWKDRVIYVDHQGAINNHEDIIFL